MMIFVLVFSAVVMACGGTSEKAKIVELQDLRDDLPFLETVQTSWLAEAKGLAGENSDNWLAHTDCDGIIWAGKYAATSCDDVNIEAAEFETEPGRFSRRPPPRCWTPDGGDQGSKTTWSRDMAVAGLIPWAYRCNRLDVLERHRDYGLSANWVMGQPLDDGRAVYTPNVLSLLHQTISALGGDGSAHEYWPELYPSGLDDFEAHLQVNQIWLRGEIESSRGNSDVIVRPPNSALLDVSGTMYTRLAEHAQREPEAAFYAVAFARYSGNYENANRICQSLDLEATVGSYVRCENVQECRLADRIFACQILIDWIKAIE